LYEAPDAPLKNQDDRIEALLRLRCADATELSYGRAVCHVSIGAWGLAVADLDAAAAPLMVSI
jgi:hypothetical protein